MNLQNIITYKENKEEESKTNTLENYIENNKIFKKTKKILTMMKLIIIKKMIQVMVQITTQI